MAIPVLLDTDIGGFMDDSFALAQLLRSPELDLRLVSLCHGDTTYRARVAARLLRAAGRDDVPLALGPPTAAQGRQPLAARVAGESLADYPGGVHEDGVTALAEAVRALPAPVTLLAIGPLTNVAALLAQAPELAGRLRLVAMAGSIARDYAGEPEAVREFNVAVDVPAARAVFGAALADFVVAPLDTGIDVVLAGPDYAALQQRDDPLLVELFGSLRDYMAAEPRCPDLRLATPALFDTVAVHLAHSRAALRTPHLNLQVSEEGYTLPYADGPPVEVAMEWLDLPAFLADLAHRLRG